MPLSRKKKAAKIVLAKAREAALRKRLGLQPLNKIKTTHCGDHLKTSGQGRDGNGNGNRSGDIEYPSTSKSLYSRITEPSEKDAIKEEQVEEEEEYNVEGFATYLFESGTAKSEDDPSCPPSESQTLEKEHESSPILHCLLCFQKTKSYSLNPLNLAKGLLDEDVGLVILFALKKMLNLPKENLEKYRKVGHPKKWVSFCDQCEPLITQAFEAQKRIEELNTKLRSFQQDMKRRISSSYNKLEIFSKTTSNKEWSVLSITNEIRKHVATGTGLDTENQADSYESDDENPTRLPQTPPDTFNSSDEYSDDTIVNNFTTNKTFTNELRRKSKKNSTGYSTSGYQNITTASATVKKTGNKQTESQSVFNCALCPRLQPMQSHSFVQHVLYHYDRPYKCTKCGAFLTGNNLELEKHPQGVRRNPYSHSSHTCTVNSLVKIAYKAEKIWKCAHCKRLFDTVEERSSHEVRNHRIHPPIKSPHKCSSCIKSFRSKAEWRVHRALAHPDLAKCSCYHCDESFKIKTKENIDSFDIKEVKRHIKESHSSGIGSKAVFECDFCGANFGMKPLLQRHVDMNHSDDSNKIDLFPCPICFVRFKSRVGQQRHILGTHGLLNKEKYICDICGYSNTVRMCYAEHKFLTHGTAPEHGEPILNCSAEGCPYQCLRKKIMNIHMMKEHEMARQHKCEVCGKGFIKSEHLRYHRQIHENAAVKPFQCEICGNSFAVKNYLYIHMRLSHQNRPFASTHKKKSPRNRRINRVTKDTMATASPSTFTVPLEQVSLKTVSTAVGMLLNKDYEQLAE